MSVFIVNCDHMLDWNEPVETSIRICSTVEVALAELKRWSLENMADAKERIFEDSELFPVISETHNDGYSMISIAYDGYCECSWELRVVEYPLIIK